MRLMSSQAILRCCVHGLAATVVVAMTANCGGAGERPPPEADPLAPSGSETEAGGDITISPNPAGGILFGDNSFVDCGKQAPAQEITISNPTTADVSFSAKISAGQAYYTLSAAEGGVPVRGKTTLQIAPAPIPQESEVTTDLYAGTLEITTKRNGEVQGSPTIIRLHQTARGAIVTSTLAKTVAVGDVKAGTKQTVGFSLTNLGNADVTAKFLLGASGFQIDDSASAESPLEPGAVVAKELSFKPSAAGNYSDVLKVSFNTTAVHCKPPYGDSTLTGKGTTSVGVSPGGIDFGEVECGTTNLAYREVTITSTIAMKVTPSLGRAGGSPFALLDYLGNPLTAPISMIANATYLLRVKPKPEAVELPADTTTGVADVLKIVTDVPSTTDIPLTLTPAGAVLDFDPATEEIFAATAILQTTTRTFKIKNSGNRNAVFTLTAGARNGGQVPPAGTFALTTTTQQSIGKRVGTTAGEVPQSLTITAPGTQPYEALGQITLSSPSVLCRDVPLPKLLKVTTP